MSGTCGRIVETKSKQAMQYIDLDKLFTEIITRNNQ
jgi:hypothetical protein